MPCLCLTALTSACLLIAALVSPKCLFTKFPPVQNRQLSLCHPSFSGHHTALTCCYCKFDQKLFARQAYPYRVLHTRSRIQEVFCNNATLNVTFSVVIDLDLYNIFFRQAVHSLNPPDYYIWNPVESLFKV